jgi:uncharacterized protein (UPF0276 family)
LYTAAAGGHEAGEAVLKGGTSLGKPVLKHSTCILLLQVATRRVKQANKADIPLVDDSVSKIEHIGRETMKKLQDLRAAAAEAGVSINLPSELMSITTGTCGLDVAQYLGQYCEVLDVAQYFRPVL